ncbi:MAG: RagB/SusD family nutrient uptake outer membrane protein [Bacteroidales bacterium]
MKKFIYIILSLVFLTTSCSLDKMPSGYIDTSTAVESVEDAAKVRDYLYLGLRGMYSGSYIYSNEICSDIFHASFGFGNRMGEFYRWEWTATNGTAESLWADCYYLTAVANFLTEKIDKLDNTKFSESDKAALELYKGECNFVKAATMFELAQRFCDVYSASTAASSMGVMLVDKYAPTSDQTSYPGRSSLADTYKFINEHLSKAATAIASVSGKEASMYITIDAITAMQARIALVTGDYDTAIAKSTALISGGKYPLISTKDEFTKLWTNDSGKECMMQLYADYVAKSLPASCNYNYVSLGADGLYSPDYIPTSWLFNLYDKKDIRYTTWYTEQTLTYGTIKGKAVILNKFPGNRELQDANKKTSDYINKIKLFRIAEQYLIAAESYALKGGNDAVASDYLNQLRAKRIPSYVPQTYAGNNLITEIRNERVRELVGEGFRVLDIKRYNAGFNRSKSQNSQIISNAGSALTELLSIDASNFRFLWPIPKAEIDANPQIKGQQNNGY